MRLPLRLPLLACVVAVGACAWAAGAPAPAGAQGARVSREYVAAPGQFDLSLAEISFGAPAHVARQGASGSRRESPIRLALRGTAGLNYVAGAVTRFSVRGRQRVLVLVVNRRPRGSLAPDLARIGLTVTAPRRLGLPVLVQISNAFKRGGTGLKPALCDLPIRGASLRASDLRSALNGGLQVGGFGAAAAVAQAYDAVCGRPYDAAFRAAVTQGSSPRCEPPQASIVACCPPNAMCAPPPCPPCPCGPGPCPMAVGRSGQAALACPLQSQTIACRL
jgi:hypothetical protein